MNAAQINRFIRAGNATFTLQSAVTGKHFTYSVRERLQGTRTHHFVRVLTGPDTFAYLGIISDGRLLATGASKISEDALSFKALAWFMRHLAKLEPDALPDARLVTFRHEGRCGRCGRRLTHPESIDSGLGPECVSR